MNLYMPPDWVRRTLEKYGEPEGCPKCGAIAGSCGNYPQCQQENVMHYKNGREAKNGDKIMIVDGYNKGASGILYDAIAGNDYCNGKLAPIGFGVGPNLKECLHLDDVLAALPSEAAAS